MNDDIKQEPTNRYSTRLRNSLRHINYAEDYPEFNYNSESSDDNRIFSRRINLNTSLAKNRKRRKIYNEKNSLMYTKLDRNSDNYENDNDQRDNINSNNNENLEEIDDDNDTINENEIENVDEISTDNNNQIGSNNLTNSTESNHYNTRYNTRSHHKKLVVKSISAETTDESQNIDYIKSLNEDDSDEFLNNKNDSDNDENNENNENGNNEVINENHSMNNEDAGSKIIEDDLENSFGNYIYIKHN